MRISRAVTVVAVCCPAGSPYWKNGTCRPASGSAQHDAHVVGALAARELERREPGEAADLVGEMRLVVETALLGERSPRHLAIAAIEQRERAAEAVHARERLG